MDTPLIDCLVVGGIADGAFLRGMRADANIIQLSRPTHLKPLATPDQQNPEAAKETEDYRVMTLMLDGPDDSNYILGIAIPVTSSMAEAFGTIVVKYVKQTLEDVRQDEPMIQH